MNKVTIKELYWEINQDTYANNVWNGYKDIEVVPRKMVEMIIEKLVKNKIACQPDSYATYTLNDAICYAESLLKKFEEE